MNHPDDHASASDTHAHSAVAHHETVLDEPKTPGWLPALGAGLLGMAALGWLATRAAAPTLSELTPPAPSAQTPPAPPPAPAPAPEPEPAVAVPSAPAGSVAAPGHTGNKAKSKVKAKLAH